MRFPKGVLFQEKPEWNRIMSREIEAWQFAALQTQIIIIKPIAVNDITETDS